VKRGQSERGGAEKMLCRCGGNLAQVLVERGVEKGELVIASKPILTILQLTPPTHTQSQPHSVIQSHLSYCASIIYYNKKSPAMLYNKQPSSQNGNCCILHRRRRC
jgi:hypothetical protein